MRYAGGEMTGGGRPPGRPNLGRLLLPFSGEPRRNTDVPDRVRALRMLDAALRVGVGGLILWWLLRL
ncbi:hypothetical protein [Sphingomonas sp. 1P08PE]|uniref:hypothetical protein n=1 Tax=Sphingomonas sp. 1P08PE TaxID=554122 RepID=UPI0039A19E3E